MSVIDTISEAAYVIDALAEDLNSWKISYHDQCSPEENELTAQLIERAYEVTKKLRGEL